MMRHAMCWLIGVGLFATWSVSVAQEAPGFVDHGVGARVAELRGIVATQTSDGRNLVIATACDQSPNGYVLVTDVDSGKTRQVFCPANVPQFDPFGAVLASTGKFYHSQGKHLLELDLNTFEWTFQGIPTQNASCYMCYTEALDGTIWGGGVYQSNLISYNPSTGELKDHGRADPQEQYLQYLATDDKGWVYCAIGTARQGIVAYNPQTGEKRQLIPEADRVLGSALVYPTADGAAYGRANGKHYRLYEGAATQIEQSAAAAPRAVKAVKYGSRLRDFPDGRRVVDYDIEGRIIRVQGADGGELTEIPFDYESEGASITSLAAGPEGMVYASTCHPMHFVAFDVAAGEVTDMGPVPPIGGGNFCAITALGDQVIGAEYAGGRLWAYDVTKPWNTQAKAVPIGIPAQELTALGTVDNGHLSYLSAHDIVFIHGDAWNAQATFELQAPEAGAYYLHIVPFVHTNYCTVQFSLDGKDIGEPFVGASNSTQAGPLQVFGPIELTAGAHTLGVRMLNTEGQEPFFGIHSVLLSQQRIEAPAQGGPNPRILAQWKDDVCRPRTALAHPDGVHVMMGGFAGYGLCGGGIGIYNMQTAEATLLTAEKELLPGHSCITLKALPDGNLVGATSVSAPGGGQTTATEAELFMLDWSSRKLIYHAVVVPGVPSIVSIEVGPDGLVYGLASNSTFFVFDPQKQEIVHSESFAAYGQAPRHAFQLSPDGRLFALLNKAIVEIEPGTFGHTKLADAPVPISAGGAFVDGKLVFAGNSHVWSYQVDPR